MQAPAESHLAAKAGGHRPGDKGLRVHCVNIAGDHFLFLVTIHCNSVSYFYSCTEELSGVAYITRRP
jgi:hypothetical protein